MSTPVRRATPVDASTNRFRGPQSPSDARPILPYESALARAAATQDLGVAIGGWGGEVRKTVNELEQSLRAREQENLNLKILVRELEEERRAEDLSCRLLDEAAAKIQSSWRSMDGAVVQESLLTPSPARSFRASDARSMRRPPVLQLDNFSSDFPRPHVDGSRQQDPDSYHEETRTLRAQLNSLATKLAQSEASCTLASAQIERTDQQVLSLIGQLLELKTQMESVSRSRAFDQVEIRQLREVREQLEGAKQRQSTVIAELDKHREHDTAALREMTQQLDELKSRAQREMDEGKAREQQREVESHRQEEVQHGCQRAIEKLAKENSEYRATVIQQEASIAELKAHLARDSALVGQLKCRVEQQEGLLVEQSAQLCQQEAHIADLERELKQQQAWESLGVPVETSHATAAARGEEEDGSLSDADGRVSGGRGQAVAAAAARRVAAAESEVVALDKFVLDLRADKEKLASLLQEEQQITRSLVQELSESHRLVFVLQEKAAFGNRGNMHSPLPACAQTSESPDLGPPASSGVLMAMDGSRKPILDSMEGAAAMLGAAAVHMREVQEGPGGVGDVPVSSDSLRGHLDAVALCDASQAQESSKRAGRGSANVEREQTLTVLRKSDGDRAREETTRGGGARECESGRRGREVLGERQREGEEGRGDNEKTNGEEQWRGGEKRSERTQDDGWRRSSARKLLLDTSPPHTAAIQREADLRRRIFDLESAGREEHAHGSHVHGFAARSPVPVQVHQKTYTATRSAEVDALLKDVAQLLQATPLIPRRSALYRDGDAPRQYACAVENLQSSDTAGRSAARGSATAREREHVAREVFFGHAIESTRSPLNRTPPPEPSVVPESRSLSLLSSRPTAVQSASVSHERSMTGDQKGHGGELPVCDDMLNIALQKWREREAERDQRGQRPCEGASPWIPR